MEIDTGITKTVAKLTWQREEVIRHLDDFVNRIQTLRGEIQRNVDSGNESLSSLQRVLLYQLVKEMNEWSNTSVKEHRDIHGLISKLGKDIDKSFVMEFGSVIGEVHSLEDPESKKCVIQSIHESLIQHGLLDIAEQLVKEAEVDSCDFRQDHESTVSCEAIAELNRVVEALKRDHIIEPAAKWCARHRIELDHVGSPVEFELHRLAFLSELANGVDKSATDAVQWRKRMLELARNLSPFASRYPAAVQSLMGCLAFVGPGRPIPSGAHISPSGASGQLVPSTMPYQELVSFSPSAWTAVADLLHKTACQLLGLPKRAAVETAITVGSRAVPPLFQIIQVVQRRQCQGFLRDMESELPIEIPIPDDCVFHSIFACPILKGQTTPSNPPLRLACGHVISREVLTKLAVGNRIRCPYCPNIDQNPNDARPVFF